MPSGRLAVAIESGDGVVCAHTHPAAIATMEAVVSPIETLDFELLPGFDAVQAPELRFEETVVVMQVRWLAGDFET